MGVRIAVAVLLATAWTLVAFTLPAWQAPQATGTQAQDSEDSAALYEVEVLPGVGATGTPANLTETTGWHPDKDTAFLGIDIAAGADTPVHAAFKVIKNPSLYAQVLTVVTTGVGCRMVEIEILKMASSPGTADVPVGRMRYIHVVAGVSVGDLIPLVGGSGADKVGKVVAHTKDGANCPTGGDHLHQSANVSDSTTSMWRNVDVAGRYEDDGLGFDDYPPVPITDPAEFCSDTWLFKIYPPKPANKTKKAEHAPRATPFERCAAPDNPPGDLAVTEGDGKLRLTWKAPSLVSGEGEAITGYQVRWRDTASKPDAAWDSDWANIPNSTAKTTSHELAAGLTNGNTYAVQVRAVNKTVEQKDLRGVVKRGGGPPATVKGTLRASPVSTSTPVVSTPAATLKLSHTRVAENGGSATVSATLSGPAPPGGASLTVSASGGSGYGLSANRTLSFAAGATSSTGAVTITARHDADTTDETVRVSASVKSGAITAPSAVTLTIDDDDLPAATLKLSRARIAEDGGSSTVSATLSGPAPAGGASLTVSASGGSGYSLSSNGTLTFAAGATRSTGVVTITARDDTDTTDETVRVSASVKSGAITAPSAVTLTINDDDLPTATLKLSRTRVAENGGSATVSATLSGPAPPGGASLTVSASGGSGYGLSANRTLSFAAGATSSTGAVTITARHDADTTNETVRVSASVKSGAITAPSAVTLTIDDDDLPAATLKLSRARIAENGGSATVSATLSGPAPLGGASLTVSASGGSGYGLSANRTLSFAAGATSSTGAVTITARHDADTTDETVHVSATVKSGAITAPTAVMLTINDDDLPPPPTYLVTVKKAGSGTGTVLPGSGQYRGWEAFTATATGSSTFGGWSGCDRVTGASCSVNVTEPRTITATFKPPQCTVVAVASKGGTVSGGGTVDCGTAVPIRASAKAGFCFSYWNQLLAPGNFAQATSSVCLTSGTLNVTTSSGTRNQIYQAVFRAKRSYTLTVVGGTGSGSYLEGTWATASAPAGKCFLGTAYIFKRWTGDSSSTLRTVRIKMDGNKSVTATFTVAGTCPFAGAEAGETAPHVADDP